MKYFDLRLLCLLFAFWSYEAVARFYPVNGGMVNQQKTVTTASTTTTFAATGNQTYIFEGSQPQTALLPPATSLPLDWWYELVNNSTGIVTVNDGSGALLQTLAAGQVGHYQLAARSNSAGTWKQWPWFPASNFYSKADFISISAGASSAGKPVKTNSSGFVDSTFLPALQSPLTTKGDIYAFSTQSDRIPVGANAYVLTADSAQPFGIKWAAPALPLSIGSFSSTPSATGLTLAASVLNMDPADATHPGGVSIATQTIAGAKTLTGATTESASGASSTPSLLLSGTPFAGTATTAKPMSLIEWGSPTTNNWATAGAAFGINAASGFSGDLMMLQNNGVKQLEILNGGKFVYKMPANNTDEFCLEANSSAAQYCWSMNGSTLLFYQSATGYMSMANGFMSLGPSTPAPKYGLDVSQSSGSTAPLTDIVPSSGSFNLPVVNVRNIDTTVNAYAAFLFTGGNSTQNPTVELVGVFENSTAASETGHLDINIRNAGTVATRLSLSKTGGLTLSGYGAGAAIFDSSGVVSSNTTTGSGNSVLATAPTMTNPVVGTQASLDNSTKAASTAYVDAAVISGAPSKDACNYATTAALPSVIYANGSSGVGATLTGVALAAISTDGSSPSVNQRILVKNQASTVQNGIYTVTATGSGIAVFVLTRATDNDQSAELQAGSSTFILSGTVNGSTTWDQNSASSPVIGTDPITFVQSAGPGSVTAGTGITITGNSVAITNTAVTPGSYTLSAITVNAQGQITAASNGSASVTPPVVQLKTSNYVATTGDDFIICKVATSDMTVTFYTASSASRRPLQVKNASQTGTCTVKPISVSEGIFAATGNETQVTISPGGDALGFEPDGSATWYMF